MIDISFLMFFLPFCLSFLCPPRHTIHVMSTSASSSDMTCLGGQVLIQQRQVFFALLCMLPPANAHVYACNHESSLRYIRICTCKNVMWDADWYFIPCIFCSVFLPSCRCKCQCALSRVRSLLHQRFNAHMFSCSFPPFLSLSHADQMWRRVIMSWAFTAYKALLQKSSTKETYILQKRPIISRSLLIS